MDGGQGLSREANENCMELASKILGLFLSKQAAASGGGFLVPFPSQFCRVVFHQSKSSRCEPESGGLSFFSTLAARARRHEAWCNARERQRQTDIIGLACGNVRKLFPEASEGDLEYSDALP